MRSRSSGQSGSVTDGNLPTASEPTRRPRDVFDARSAARYSSSIWRTTGAIAATVSPGSTRIVRTPRELRPTRRTSSAAPRRPGLDAHRPPALRASPAPPDPLGGAPLHLAGRRDREQILILRPDERAGEQAGLLRDLVADHALATAALDRVIGEPRALPVAVLRDADHLLALGRQAELDHLVFFGQAHADHAGGRTAHRTREPLLEPDGLALARYEEHVVLAVGELHVDQFVVGLQVDRGEPGPG